MKTGAFFFALNLNSPTLKIKAWAKEDQPFYKLLQGDPSHLTNAELIAILLRSGSQEESALDLSKRLLASQGNRLRDLLSLGEHQLCSYKGIGLVKASNLLAVAEILKRLEEQPAKVRRVKNSHDAYVYMRSKLAFLEHEEFWVLYLNNSNKVLARKRISKGGLTSTLVDCREVLRWALDLRSTAIVICHNHPSDSLNPSSSDKELTEKIIKAAELMDIVVLDHLILTKESYFSFNDEGLIA